MLIESEIDTADNNLSGTIDRWPLTENEISSNIELKKGESYTISFWYRLKGLGYMMYPFNFYIYQDNTEKFATTIEDYDWSGEWVPLSPFKYLDDTGWQFFSLTFTADSETNASFYMTTEQEKVWVDELKLKVTE